MNEPKPSIRIKVDATNPGQFFACCGLLELADRPWPGAEGWFEEREFCISSPDEQSTLEIILDYARSFVFLMGNSPICGTRLVVHNGNNGRRIKRQQD